MGSKIVNAADIDKLVADAEKTRVADAKSALESAGDRVRIQDNCVCVVDSDALTFTITGSIDPERVNVEYTPGVGGKKGTLKYVSGGGWDFRGPRGERFTLTGYRKV